MEYKSIVAISLRLLHDVYIHNYCFFQTIQNDPNGVEDIAKAHKKKNRYLNIHTCKGLP